MHLYFGTFYRIYIDMIHIFIYTDTYMAYVGTFQVWSQSVQVILATGAAERLEQELGYNVLGEAATQPEIHLGYLFFGRTFNSSSFPMFSIRGHRLQSYLSCLPIAKICPFCSIFSRFKAMMARVKGSSFHPS